MTSIVTSFLLKLLLLVERPPNVQDPRRHQVVAELLISSECCLQCRSDLPAKFRRRFKTELEEVISSEGLCPLPLYTVILVLRSRLSMDTQDVEGANSVLQTMCKMAPSIKHGLVSDRMRAKLGDPIKISECCDLHGAVVSRMATTSHFERVLPVDPRASPAEAAQATCDHVLIDPWAYRFQLGIKDRCSIAAGTVYCFQHSRTGPRVGFVLCWSYYVKVWLARAC